MSSDADLSTDDLARPAGARGQDTSGAEGRPSDQHAGATGTGLDEGAPPTGGTRTEAVQAHNAPREDAGTAPGQEAAAGTVPAGARPGASAGSGDGTDVALLDPADGERFRQQWNDVQARFVDDPQEAVRTADGLVAELMQSLARGFSEHKGRLESAWQSGGHPDTEELRQALQRYRSFFDRLLSA
jgi:hypothetical protein